MRFLAILFSPAIFVWNWARHQETTRGKVVAYGGLAAALLLIVLIIAGSIFGSGADDGEGDGEQAVGQATDAAGEATEPALVTDTPPPPQATVTAAASTDTPLPPDPTDTPVPLERTESPIQPQAQDGLELRVSVSDLTIDQPADDVEVWLRGFGSWFPDLTFGGDVVTYEMLFAEGLPDMFVYPDGRGGTEIPITLSISGDFIPGSVRDMVEITISDTTVTVGGTAIPDLEAEFAR